MDHKVVSDALLHLAYTQMKDGLYEDAADTFSAAHLLNRNDDRAVQGRDLAHAHRSQSSPIKE